MRPNQQRTALRACGLEARPRRASGDFTVHVAGQPGAIGYIAPPSRHLTSRRFSFALVPHGIQTFPANFAPNIYEALRLMAASLDLAPQQANV